MCHRIVPLLMQEVEYLLRAQRDEGRAKMPAREEGIEVSDAYPGKTVPLIVPNVAGELEAAERAWGFAAPQGSRKLVFNTRLDTALSHVRRGYGLWAEPLTEGRCLVPVAAFYESWTRNPPRRGMQARFTMPGFKAFLLAGVQQGECFSVVTTEPNREVGLLHSRMPLVLGPGESRIWLGPNYAALADRSGVALDVVTEG